MFRACSCRSRRRSRCASASGSPVGSAVPSSGVRPHLPSPSSPTSPPAARPLHSTAHNTAHLYLCCTVQHTHSRVRTDYSFGSRCESGRSVRCAQRVGGHVLRDGTRGALAAGRDDGPPVRHQSVHRVGYCHKHRNARAFTARILNSTDRYSHYFIIRDS